MDFETNHCVAVIRAHARRLGLPIGGQAAGDGPEIVVATFEQFVAKRWRVLESSFPPTETCLTLDSLLLCCWMGLLRLHNDDLQTDSRDGLAVLTVVWFSSRDLRRGIL